jgi:hypothetical protein
VSDTSPSKTLRGRLPAEMRVVRGALGLAGGVALLFAVTTALLGGNWQLGFGDTRPLAPAVFAVVPALLGVASPLWYWAGRPAWHRLDRPGADLAAPLAGATFLPGVAATAVGVALLLPVTATSGRPVQVLAPLGVFVALAGPLWFWFGRPLVGERVERALPDAAAGDAPSAAALRASLGGAVLVAAAVAVGVATALPVVAVGDPVTAGGLTVTVSDATTADSVVEAGGGDAYGDSAWRLLLVRIVVENRGDEPRSLPGGEVTEISLVAPACSAQNFGEPANNCNEVYLDGPFEAGERRYANYDDQQAAVGGTVAPGGRVTGWLVFRVEGAPASGDGPAMLVVDGVGRWSVTEAVGAPASARVK